MSLRDASSSRTHGWAVLAEVHGHGLVDDERVDAGHARGSASPSGPNPRTSPWWRGRCRTRPAAALPGPPSTRRHRLAACSRSRQLVNSMLRRSVLVGIRRDIDDGLVRPQGPAQVQRGADQPPHLRLGQVAARVSGGTARIGPCVSPGRPRQRLHGQPPHPGLVRRPDHARPPPPGSGRSAPGRCAPRWPSPPARARTPTGPDPPPGASPPPPPPASITRHHHPSWPPAPLSPPGQYRNAGDGRATAGQRSAILACRPAGPPQPPPPAPARNRPRPPGQSLMCHSISPYQGCSDTANPGYLPAECFGPAGMWLQSHRMAPQAAHVPLW